LTEEIELPHRQEKPWGYEIWWALTDKYAGKILHVDAGHKLSLQYHNEKEESSYLLSGNLILHKGTDVDNVGKTHLEPGACWHNMPGEIHTIEAISDCDVLEVSTPELHDVIRLADDYGRKGTSAL
jgi:mannose-6-phosphate isomerase